MGASPMEQYCSHVGSSHFPLLLEMLARAVRDVFLVVIPFSRAPLICGARVKCERSWCDNKTLLLLLFRSLGLRSLATACGRFMGPERRGRRRQNLCAPASQHCRLVATRPARRRRRRRRYTGANVIEKLFPRFLPSAPDDITLYRP